MAARNPFKPTAGVNPPDLIGRQDVLEEFDEALENGVGAPSRLMRVSGIRGVGKTALLNALGDVARARGFQVVNVSSTSGGVCRRIAEDVRATLPAASLSLEPEALGFKVGSVTTLGREPANLHLALREATRRRGLLVTVDEIQDIDRGELRDLGNDVRLVMRDGADIAFAFAGLPLAVDEAVNEPGLTFLQRSVSVELSLLADYEVRGSLEDTVRASGMVVSDEVSRQMTLAAGGYPFMVQLVGYHCWQEAHRRGSREISADDAARGVVVARRSFESSVIRPTLDRLPKGQVAYLRAMASCGDGPVRSGDVAAAAGATSSAVAAARARLLRAGVIAEAGYGRAVIAIPHMAEYLRSHADEPLS